MNSELSIVPNPAQTPEPIAEPPAESDPALDLALKTLPPPKSPKSKGKIAALSKEHRTLINHMFEDGATYKQVAQEMAKHGISLNGENLSNWFNGPFQIWLQQKEWRAEIHFVRESADELDQFSHALKFQETLIQVALTDIFRTFQDRALKPDSPQYTRLFHALARLNREALGLRKYTDQCARDQTEQLKKRDPDRDLEDKERGLMLAAMERAMGFKAAPGPIGPDINDYIDRLQNPALSSSSSSSASASSSPITPSSSSSSSSSFSSSSSEPGSRRQEALNNDPDPSCRGRGNKTLINQSEPSIQNQNSKIKNPEAESQSSIQNPVSSIEPPPIENQKSKIKNPADRCHCCHQELPPLLPDGTRPFSHCQRCGTALRSPATLHLYCPACFSDLRHIFVEDQRTSSTCPYCSAQLPPWPVGSG